MDYRADRMKALIIQNFMECLEKGDFSVITVGEIAGKARINRSTFYRYFEDKYALRDCVIDQLVQEFSTNLEIDFLYMDIVENKAHAQELEESLMQLYENKQVLEILWGQKLLGRNLFEEMLDAGAEKVEAGIRSHPTITDERKQYADWYARLLVTNFLVTVRWWFAHMETVSIQQVTKMMRRHMCFGAIPTLKEWTE